MALHKHLPVAKAGLLKCLSQLANESLPPRTVLRLVAYSHPRWAHKDCYKFTLTSRLRFASLAQPFCSSPSISSCGEIQVASTNGALQLPEVSRAENNVEKGPRHSLSARWWEECRLTNQARYAYPSALSPYCQTFTSTVSRIYR